TSPMSFPRFTEEFRAQFRDLLAWRRDVRRFRADPLAPGLLEDLIALASLAPSVGNSQPWRFVIVEDPARRDQVIDTFRDCNHAALATYSGTRASLYAGLKLAGLVEAPVHLAIFVDNATSTGHRLGRLTMPETLRYSTV